MYIENDVIYKKPYYKLTRKESMENIDIFNKFINWTSGEFDLCLQEDAPGLKVYYPNGHFTIQKLTSKKDLNIEITVYSKSIDSCKRTYFKLECVFNHIKELYGLDELIY